MSSSVLVIGGSGFIGSNLCRWLSREGNVVTNLDRLIPRVIIPGVEFIQGDASIVGELNSLFSKLKPEVVYHLAANSDIASGVADASLDFGDTLGTTTALRQAVERSSIRQLIFASSSAVFGDSRSVFAEVTHDFREPISWYGRAKLTSEFVLESLSRSRPDISVLIARFPNVVGPHATHGVLYDFIHKLKSNPNLLRILGDGNQLKPYIHVEELIRALEFLRRKITDGVSVFNIGPDDRISVREIAELVSRHIGLNPTFLFGDTPYGWIGDVPSYQFDAAKLRDAGFQVTMSSRTAINLAISQLAIEIGVSR